MRKELQILHCKKWAPNLSELNLLDHFIWENISNHIEYHKVKTVNDLRRESDEES